MKKLQVSRKTLVSQLESSKGIFFLNVVIRYEIINDKHFFSLKLFGVLNTEQDSNKSIHYD